MDLFQPMVPTDKQHDISEVLLHPSFAPELEVILGRAAGFVDRDSIRRIWSCT